MWFWSSLGFGSLFWSRFGFGFDCGTFLGEIGVVVDESVDAVVSFGRFGRLMDEAILIP